jgi:2-amino-4-hydroxy-6-hydroxymethyldihydropteridine diphosphokinase
MTKRRQSGLVAVAVGANVAGSWGSPLATIQTALREMEATGIGILAASRIYRTPAMGFSPQPDYLNAVLLVTSPKGPAAIMRSLKAIERKAGRRAAKPWGPRPLDLDLLFSRGTRLGLRRPGGKRTAHQSRPLLLPHPGLEDRAFVLIPLRELAPHFHSPASGRSLTQLVHALPARAVGLCVPLDNAAQACDT